MSELIDNTEKRKNLLKHMILQLHNGEAPAAVKNQLARLMGSVPYDMVVEVEQELMAEGLPFEDVLRLCDIHSAALEGNISHEHAQTAPAGHPVHTFIEENKALRFEIDSARKLFAAARQSTNAELQTILNQIRMRVQALADIDKHYLRKEYLLFPHLEAHEITGPPKVMWGKHDETRELLKAAIESAQQLRGDVGEVDGVIDLVLEPLLQSIEGMITKEEEILFPMCMDTLSDDEWYSIYQQSIEHGFCLYDPTATWKPEGATLPEPIRVDTNRIQLSSGSFTVTELETVLNSIPFDLTFVDADDKVRYFTQGRERIFSRNRAILGRSVQMCHPPSSVHIVDQILSDFKSGKESSAPFWINMGGRFIHIEYFALRDNEGKYLGTLEVSQNLTAKRSLSGEQRLLTYAKVK